MAFNELFERDFLRMVFHKKEYMVEFAGVIDPEMFSFPVFSTLWLLFQQFYFEHKELPSEAALYELLQDAVDDKLFMKDEIEILEQYVPAIVVCEPDEVVNFEFIQARVSQWAQDRLLRARVAEIVQQVQAGKADVDEVILLLKGAVLPRPVSLDEEDFVATMVARVQNLVDCQDGLFLPTGIVPLDDALGGGFKRRTKGYIMGPPQGGKSTFCSAFAGHLVRLNLNVVYCYNDESTESLNARMAGNFGDIGRRDFLAGGARALEKVRVAYDRLTERRVGKLILKWLPNLAKPSDVTRVVERLVESGTKVDLIVVDHIGKMQPETGMTKDNWLDVKRIFGGLSDLCIEYDCVVLCVMHTNKDAEGRSRLSPKQMGLSYEPTKDADFGLGAFRLEEDKGAPGPLSKDFGRIQILKSRGPGAGMLFRVEADFEKCRYKMADFIGQEGVVNATKARGSSAAA